MAMVIRLRVCLGRPGRVQISPHAYRVIRSWNSSLNEFLFSSARFTCLSPRTARRTSTPFVYRSDSSMDVPPKKQEISELLPKNAAPIPHSTGVPYRAPHIVNQGFVPP